MDRNDVLVIVKPNETTARLTYSMSDPKKLDRYARDRLRTFVEEKLGYRHVAVGQYHKENVVIADLQRDAIRFEDFHLKRPSSALLSNFEITAAISGTLSIRLSPTLSFDEIEPLDESRLLLELSKAA